MAAAPSQTGGDVDNDEEEEEDGGSGGGARKWRVKRTCSAMHCGEGVPNRAGGDVVLCILHRRFSDGVPVRGCAEPMRWCRHCNKAHALRLFADSVIGPPRKLAYCEKGRVSRLRTKADNKAVDNKAVDSKPAIARARAMGGGAGGGKGGGEVHMGYTTHMAKQSEEEQEDPSSRL